MKPKKNMKPKIKNTPQGKVLTSEQLAEATDQKYLKVSLEYVERRIKVCEQELVECRILLKNVNEPMRKQMFKRQLDQNKAKIDAALVDKKHLISIYNKLTEVDGGEKIKE